jgi:hypothetical protein
MVWVLGTAFALIFGFLGGVADVIAAKNEDVENGTVEPYISFWASAAGTVIGTATAALLAGRQVPQATSNIIDAQIVEEPPQQPR